MPCGFRLTKGIKFYLKRSTLPCFGSWNHKGEIASLQGLQEYGKSGKKTFIRENIFCKFDTSYTLLT